MITLSAKIDLISSQGGTIDSAASNISGINISSDINAIIGREAEGSNPFIFGISILGNGATFSNGVDYYIGSVKSDENGLFSESYFFTISGKDISFFTIVFDRVNGSHPLSLVVDGEVVEINSPIHTFFDLEVADTHYITISNWNKPNDLLRIQGIYSSLSLDINRHNLVSINRKIDTRADNRLPSWGIISNIGNLEFNDNNGSLLNYINEQLLDETVRCKMYLNNTVIKGASVQIAEMIASDWQYNNDNGVVSVSLKDDLEEWQNINIKALNYDPRKQGATDGYPYNYKWFYEYLYERTPTKFNMTPYAELDEDTKYVLENTWSKYPLLKAGTLWQQWEKICKVCQSYIWKDNMNTTRFATKYGA